MTRLHPCIKCGEPCDCMDDSGDRATDDTDASEECIGCSDCYFDFTHEAGSVGGSDCRADDDDDEE